MVMICCPKEDLAMRYPAFLLAGMVLDVVSRVKHTYRYTV